MSPSRSQTPHGLGTLAVLALLILACREPERPDVLIVTLDTARADAFGAYGSRTGASPAIDALARRGVVFEAATAPVPLTLPSHASLFTGTFPPHHGVRENGSSMVPQDLVTLAELFRDRGYETGAFVGAYVLDARWGLDQGFDRYAGEFDATSPDVFSIADLERPANEVIDDALEWLGQRDGRKPLLAWVHLFDPHTPYAPPSPFDQRYPDDPYAGEIAFADSQLGRLLEAVNRETTIVVIAGDHGEGFGEHEENGHGLLLYEEVLRVPLVIAAPGRLPDGRRVSTPVSLVDVYPTLAELAGIEAQAVHGHSLVPLANGESSHATPIYAETLYPRLRFGWSDLQVLRDGGLKLIESSRPELYDLAADPDESSYLAGERAVAMRDLRGRLRRAVAAFEAGAPEPASTGVDAETRARLLALGYVAGPTAAPAGGDLPPPRDKIAIFDALNAARAKIAAGQPEEAEKDLVAIAAGEPNMLEGHVALGELHLRNRRWAEAAEAFRRGYALAPEDPTVIAALATADVHAGRAKEALELLSVAIERAPAEPRFRFVAGRAQLGLGDLDAAKKQFESVLELNPRSAAALVELAGIAVAEKSPDRARELATRALAIDPGARGARLFLAQALERLDRPEDAWAEASAELERNPGDFRAAWYLAELAPHLGRDQEIERYLRMAIEAEPRFIPAYLRLARHYLERGELLEEGVRLTRQALELAPAGRDRALAHFLLADFYSRLGRSALSSEHARLGREAQDAASR